MHKLTATCLIFSTRFVLELQFVEKIDKIINLHCFKWVFLATKANVE